MRVWLAMFVLLLASGAQAKRHAQVPNQKTGGLVQSYLEQRTRPGDPGNIGNEKALELARAHGIPLVRGSVKKLARKMLPNKLGGPGLRIKPISGGTTGAQLYRVYSRHKNYGVLKIYRNAEEMLRDQAALHLLNEHKLERLQPVRMPRMALTEHQGKVVAAALFDKARGRSVEQEVRTFKGLEGTPRQRRLKKLSRMVTSVADALAELHGKTVATTPISRRVKQNNHAYWLRQGWIRAQKKIREKVVFAPLILPRLDNGLERLIQDYLNTDLPGVMCHGDATDRNFFVQDRHVTMIDSETLLRSTHGKRRVYPAAADVGRFVESLSSNGLRSGMTPAEINGLKDAFLSRYLASVDPKKQRDTLTAIRFFQAHLALVHLSRMLDRPNATHRDITLRRLIRVLRDPP